MKKQLDALENTRWDVLIILDACRSDYFLRLCDSTAEVVESPATCTRHWIHATLDRQLWRDATYVNTNPVVQGVLSGRAHDAAVHYIRRGTAGTVYPEVMTDYVVDRIIDEGQPAKLVMHFLQPHSPCIGSWKETEPHWPDRTECRCEDYAANLWRVWQEVQECLEELQGRIIITADHGELLRAHDGRKGHKCEWSDDTLRRVPWLEIDQRVQWNDPGPVSRESIEERMKALGYA